MNYENKHVVFSLKPCHCFEDLTAEAFKAYGFSPEFRQAFVTALYEKFKTPNRVKSAMSMFDHASDSSFILLAPGVSVIVVFRLYKNELILEFETCDIALRYSGKSYTDDDTRLIIDHIIDDYTTYINYSRLNS